MIIITGASSGFGAACARELAGPGVELFLLARRLERLRTLATELKSLGAKVHIAALDIRSPQAIDQWFQSHQSDLRRTSVLINNAGLAKGVSKFQELELKHVQAMIETNVLGLIHITRLLLPEMIQRRSGHIVNMGSVAGRWAYPGGNVYCASKAAVAMLSENLRLDLQGTGIRVTEIAPGMAETEFSEVRFEDKDRAKAVYSGMTPLSAKDIAELVAFCLSRPQHVNIQQLVVFPTDQASVTNVHRSATKKE